MKKINSIHRRIWGKINKNNPNGCWEWTGLVHKGYGRIKIGGESSDKRKMVLVHRVMFELFKGDIPNNYLICHTCDNRKCVNPDHLFCGTSSDNMQDCINKGRHANQKKNYCKNGHLYSDENTIIYGSRRLCRICRNAIYKRYRIKKKENNTK